MNVTVLETEYFPCISWFAAYCCSESVALWTDEHFVRSSYRNRCDLAGPHGRLRLSVPLAGGRNAQRKTRDVRVSYDDRWTVIHCRTLESAYRRTPFYTYFEDDLHHFFEQRPSFLIDLNQNALEWILRILNLPGKFQDSPVQIEPTPCWLPKFTPASESQTNYPTYLQPFIERNGFISGLSILDPLFCLGPAATRAYLETVVVR
ncbi:MAG: WbqC family protein [Bacteroidota bacterium]|nr:MAG: WbqC family protein [Bacteroidota bacterium]